MTEYLENNDLMPEGDVMPSDWIPENSIIKVIGVGGGGCNAVNYMYKQRIEGCTFIVCNTDAQALNSCDVPIKIQLGEGLGAGCNPTEGRNAALNSQEEIAEKVINSNTDMLFITAGMGGGTGTGAAPVIAAMAKKKGILTVGVVTIPFKSEGNESMSKAIDGINELEKNVDSLIIINNEKIYKEYGDLLIQEAFPKADEVLATAVKGITEIIKKRGFINVDFKDVKTMMTDSGMALMGCGTGIGANRIKDAVKSAMDSPLLNDFDIKTAKNVLINITGGHNKDGLLMKQLDEIDKMIKEYTGKANNFKRGIVFDDDPEFGDKVNITVIATGFKMARITEIAENVGNIITVDVKGITEIIKKRGFINVDFKDVKTMMTDSGMALMGCGTGIGANRIKDAVKSAMDSPLLNDFDIKTAKNVLINITGGHNKDGLLMKQLDEIDKMIKEYTGKANNFKRGIVFDDDPEFGDKVNITVIATGFKMARITEIAENVGNIITVDSNFTYNRENRLSEEGIELPEIRSVKIGYNNTAIRKGLSFEDGRKPVLLIREGESKSELEDTPAIKRVAGRNKE